MTAELPPARAGNEPVTLTAAAELQWMTLMADEMDVPLLLLLGDERVLRLHAEAGAEWLDGLDGLD